MERNSTMPRSWAEMGDKLAIGAKYRAGDLQIVMAPTALAIS